jgi:magnesium chelatase subunit ChlD-like protein
VIVDASASTRRNQALSQAKGVVAGFFEQAYRSRARLALLTASGDTPVWQQHGLKASMALQSWLDNLGAGGGTPLLAAFDQAAQWLQLRRKQHPDEQQRILVVTDGRVKNPADVPRLDCPGMLIDIECGPVRLRRSEQIATRLGLEYHHISTLRARPA